MKELRVELNKRSASFETAAEPVLGPREARTRRQLPQDEEFSLRIRNLPHAEERPKGRVSKHARPAVRPLFWRLSAAARDALREDGEEQIERRVAENNVAADNDFTREGRRRTSPEPSVV